MTDPVREALARIVTTYDEYRGRGVMPAPREYRDVVLAIDAARTALAQETAYDAAKEAEIDAAIDATIIADTRPAPPPAPAPDLPRDKRLAAWEAPPPADDLVRMVRRLCGREAAAAIEALQAEVARAKAEAWSMRNAAVSADEHAEAAEARAAANEGEVRRLLKVLEVQDAELNAARKESTPAQPSL